MKNSTGNIFNFKQSMDNMQFTNKSSDIIPIIDETPKNRRKLIKLLKSDTKEEA
jgi:hypothetical protein